VARTDASQRIGGSRLRDLAPDSQEALDEGEDLPAPARLAATLRAAHEGEQTLGGNALLVRHELERLSTFDLTEIVQDYVLAYRGERAPDDVAKRIAGHCDGNPLLLHVICEGRVQRKVDVSKWLDPPLPRNVPEAFREKWDHLDGDVQDILALAAAVGQEFHGELVASCARDLRSLLCAEDPEGALTGAEQQAFVRREPGPDADVYHFFERACYEIALSESRRADLAQDVTPILVEHAIAIRERHRVEWVDKAVFLSALVMDQRASALRTTLAAHVRTKPGCLGAAL